MSGRVFFVGDVSTNVYKLLKASKKRIETPLPNRNLSLSLEVPFFEKLCKKQKA
jgi:hypothetical protein